MVAATQACGLVDRTEGAVGTVGGLDGVDEGGDAPAFGSFDEVDLIDAAMGAFAVAVEIVGRPEAGEAAADADLWGPHALDQFEFGCADAGGEIGDCCGGGFARFADGNEARVFEEKRFDAGTIVGGHAVEGFLNY